MRTRKKKNAKTKTEIKTHNPRRHCKTVRHPNGNRTCCEYDANGKCVTTFFDLAPTLTVSYHYNPRGKLLRVVRHRKPKPM